ncbi:MULTISPECIES: ferritin-like domain-containing protein [Legionella]|uniref:Bacterioferritin n=1 Tax=Legionella septentrionalis TaxID=2498109 RepID=A0A3S0VA56_9GAMM|nr:MULTISPECIES: ferritin-like domain-containing protein [Legionella]MCP0913355.1 bacterioferritin [Legionella sp. 27cVA30]RUQ85078.1 bacterioferritin [Legionella septentrionalis]RUQ95179.1 bacterioferritin [Legionella septentrionalis]RUR08634.1 bacterioferritin [Legionella septentrionalis]RUR14869.1 bacterioferritin [Legionella septentrionalis]
MKHNTAFLTDLKKIRDDARKHLTKGPVTENYHLNLATVIELLNGALATELICYLRYNKHHYKAAALGASVAASEFLEHANQENLHANQLAARIVQLGGDPNFSPHGLSERAHAEYVECETVECMVKENLVAERIAIDIYREMINYIGNADPTTRKLLEDILAVEEEHADDLLDVAAEYDIKFED